MNAIARHPRLILAMACLATVALATMASVQFNSGPARAQGIPTTNPLYYSGMLADASGKALTGSRSIGVDLYTAQSGGTKACTTAAKATALVQGRFRVALDKKCLQAIHDHADLWVEVVVDGTPMPRANTKIGAAPYAVETSDKCPRGYTWDTTSKGITLCKRGADEMVKVGDFWVDRYEMIAVDASQYGEGRCNGTGKQYGASADDFPSTFPDSGNWSTRVFACSVKGKTASHYMTWFQASNACALAGKNLCTNAQWQIAASGTPDDSASCVVDSTKPEHTGSRPKCVSSWGALDMVGNWKEWTTWWTVGGVPYMKGNGENTAPWPTGYGDGKDMTHNLNGWAHSTGGGWTKGLPGAAIRGGAWNGAGMAGVFAILLNGSPSYANAEIGARCCRRY